MYGSAWKCVCGTDTWLLCPQARLKTAAQLWRRWRTDKAYWMWFLYIPHHKMVLCGLKIPWTILSTHTVWHNKLITFSAFSPSFIWGLITKSFPPKMWDHCTEHSSTVCVSLKPLCEVSKALRVYLLYDKVQVNWGEEHYKHSQALASPVRTNCVAFNC